MRKVILSLAAAGSALAFASPAAAQYYPVPQGYAYGYNNYGQMRALQARVDNLQRHIRQLDRRNVVSDRSAERLREQSRNIERRLRSAARNGLSPYEMNDIQVRIARLEQRVQFATASRYGYNSYNGRNGHNGYIDRDRDGRDDRWERDRRRDRDDD